MGERVGPSPRRQLGDQAVGVRGAAEQDIFQIFEGWDLGEFTALDERIEERGARLARRDDREYREYLSEEQRSQAGCSAGRMQAEFHHGLLGQLLKPSGRKRGPLVRASALEDV